MERERGVVAGPQLYLEAEVGGLVTAIGGEPFDLALHPAPDTAPLELGGHRDPIEVY